MPPAASKAFRATARGGADFAFASLDAAVGDEDRAEILLATTDILSDDQVVWPSLIEGLARSASTRSGAQDLARFST